GDFLVFYTYLFVLCHKFLVVFYRHFNIETCDIKSYFLFFLYSATKSRKALTNSGLLISMVLPFLSFVGILCGIPRFNNRLNSACVALANPVCFRSLETIKSEFDTSKKSAISSIIDNVG